MPSRPQAWRDHEGGERRKHADRYRPGQTGRLAAQMSNDCLRIIRHHARRPGERDTLLGHSRRSRQADEQLHPDRGFEPGDTTADRRVIDTKFLRGGSQRTEPRGGEEIAQILPVEHTCNIARFRLRSTCF